MLDMVRYLQYKRSSGAAGGSSSVDRNMMRLYKLTWQRNGKNVCIRMTCSSSQQECYKNGSFVRPQMCRIPTSSSGKDGKKRRVNEHELKQAFLQEDQNIQLGTLYLPENHGGSPAHWSSKLLNEQAVVSRKQLPLFSSHF